MHVQKQGELALRLQILDLQLAFEVLDLSTSITPFVVRRNTLLPRYLPRQLVLLTLQVLTCSLPDA